MFDYDPRDPDARGRDDGVCDREGDWLVLGRGHGSLSVRGDEPDREPRDRDDNWRDERDRDSRDREDARGSLDPRDVFSRELDLPRGPERDLVRHRDHDYRLKGSDAGTLSTVGAFRVVSERDLRDPRDAAFDARDRDLRQLEKQGLIQRLRSRVYICPRQRKHLATPETRGFGQALHERRRVDAHLPFVGAATEGRDPPPPRRNTVRDRFHD